MNSQLEKIEESNEKSCNMDKEIYNSKISKEEIEKLLNTEQSKVLIINIKTDLLNHYYNISPIELEMLSQNIYDYCCLMANAIPEQEIIRYITEKNAKYYDKLSEKEKAALTVEFNIKFYKYLISKYTEIIKSNKQS